MKKIILGAGIKTASVHFQFFHFQIFIARKITIRILIFFGLFFSSKLSAAQFPSIEIIGSSIPPYDWSAGVNMPTTDGITYTLLNYTLPVGEVKFRQNSDWTVNWGAASFPSGFGYQDGPNIPVSAGTYNIIFNRLTGEYNFVCLPSCVPRVGIIGTALNGWLGDDTPLQSIDGVNYTLLNYTLSTGEAKFRQDNDWTVNWGATFFPSGTGYQDGPNIPIIGGTYNISFNRLTGAYTFQCLYCYCTSGLTNYGCSYYSAIDNFTLSNIQQTATGCSSDVADYTSLIVNLAQGETYLFSATSTTPYISSYEFMGIWIDFNDNFSFDDPGELVFASSTGGQFSGTISIPITAPIGNHRMRVRLKNNFDNTPLTLTDPCTTYYYGEAHDYTVNIVAAPSCSGLSSLSVSDIGTTSANVNWGCNGCSGPFIVEYGLTGFIPGTGSTAGAGGTIINASSSPTTISGLTSSTSYDVYVRRSCDANDYSLNFGTFNFTTKYDYCATLTDPINPITCGTQITANIPAGNGAVTPNVGKVLLYSFTPTASGIYTFTITNASGSVGYAIKDASTGCNGQGWKFILDYYSNGAGIYIFDTLVTGTTYYLMLEALYPSSGGSSTFQIDCYTPYYPCDNIVTIPDCSVPQLAEIPTGLGAFSEIEGYASYLGKEKIYKFTPQVTGIYTMTNFGVPGTNYNEAGLSYKKASDGCNSSGWHFINNSLPGDHTDLIGTLIGGVDYYFLIDAYNLSGVTRNFQIDCYEPSVPCNNIETISCGTPVNFSVPVGAGSIQLPVCPTNNNPYLNAGKEKIYQFTASVSGMAALQILSSSNYIYPVSYYFKNASSGCNTSGWQCVITSYNSGSNTILPEPLVAGNSYYILADAGGLAGNSQTFEITCPEQWDPCNSITDISCSTPITATIPVGIGKYSFENDPYTDYTNGKEIIYSFTASVSGTHVLDITQTDYSSPLYQYKIATYYIKDAADGCNGTGWTKITSTAYPSNYFYYSPFSIPLSLNCGAYLLYNDGRLIQWS